MNVRIITTDLTKNSEFLLIKFVKPEDNFKDTDFDCDNACLMKIKEKTGADIFITGTLAKYDLKAEKQTDSRYLAQKVNTARYLLTVKTYDLNARKTDLLINKEFYDTGMLKAEGRIISAQISSFYMKKTGPPQKTAIQAEGPVPSPLNRLAIMPSYLYATGDYSSVAGDAAGLALDADREFLSGSLILTVNLNLFMLRDKLENIESGYLASGNLFAGYPFNPYSNLYIIPFAGPGYSFHIINGTKSGADPVEKNWDLYYNPTVSGGVETSWFFTPEYSLVLKPSWGVLFEKETRSQYITVSLGLKIHF